MTTSRCMIVNGAVRRSEEIVDEQGSDPRVTVHPGAGLVLARRISRVAVLHHALSEHLPKVWSARDPADAIGITTVRQPDITLVDDDLTLMSAIDAAALIRAHAPGSRVVIFTRNQRTVARARRIGITTCGLDSSHDQVRAVVEATLGSWS